MSIYVKSAYKKSPVWKWELHKTGDFYSKCKFITIFKPEFYFDFVRLYQCKGAVNFVNFTVDKA